MPDRARITPSPNFAAAPGPTPPAPAPKVILHRGEAREYITARVQECIRQRRQQDPHIKMSQLRAEIITWLAQEFRLGWSTAYAYIAVALKALEGGSPP